MGRPFWTTGPVPTALLPDLALPRPTAQAAAVEGLAAGRTVRVGGPAGWGRTTFVQQVLAALGRPAVLVDVEGLLQGTEDEALASAAAQVGLRQDAAWPAVRAAVGPGTLLAFDGVPSPLPDWIRGIEGPVLVAGAGEVVPDPIAASTASSFLERRAARIRLAWTPPALRDAVALAAGHPARLQSIGAACAHVALEQGRRRITMDDYLEAALEVAQGRPGHGPLSALDGPRLQLLKAIVRDPEGRPTRWATRCGLDPAASVVHLGRLVEQGWLVRPSRGRYAVADPALALHVQGRHANVARVVRPAPPKG
jgi:hypothetical protein